MTLSSAYAGGGVVVQFGRIDFMKKTLKILFRIFYITVFAVVLLVVVYALLPKMWGEATIQVDGEAYLPETVTGYYELGEELKLNCAQGNEVIKFNHVKGNYGMYDYVIPIRTENIDTELVVHFFKTNQMRIDTLNIKVELYESGGIWNADVVIETDVGVREASFDDVEAGEIEMRVE